MSDGVSIHAIITKNEILPKRETLLCLSGFGCSHYNFIELAKDLGEDYQMVLIDNRGMGASADSRSDYSLETIADDALEVMDQMGIDDFHLAGISMGGFIAQLLTLKNPERVRSLSLLCTTSGGEHFVPLPKLTEEGLIQFYQLSEPRRTEIAIEATVYPALKESNFGRFSSICKLRRDHPVRVDQVLRQKRAVDKFLDQELALSEIKCPTFILTGDSDRFVSPVNAKKLHAKIQGSQLFTIEKTDHLFFLERPRRVAEILGSCLHELNPVNDSFDTQKTGALL